MNNILEPLNPLSRQQAAIELELDNNEGLLIQIKEQIKNEQNKN